MPPPPPAVPVAAAWIGTWSRPPDRPAEIAAGLAVALLLLALAPEGPRWLGSMVDFASLADVTRRRRFLVVSSFVAAFLSLGYIAFYLRGGPRAVDAATYWLQGRAMAHGELGWPVIEPSASFRARDLLFGAPDHVAGIFPPGYPFLLAPAFLVGAPMLVGPLLAAGLVVATWLLGRELATSAGEAPARADVIGRIAAGLSILSAALRYHTADALPYAAAAVGVAMALGGAMRARRTGEPRLFAVAGLAVGFLVATQPVSAITTGAIVVALAWGTASRGRALGWGCLAALPGVLLLLAAHHAAVGRSLASPMAVYFGAFDAHPPFAPRAAAITTAHRLRAHLLDVANFEPLALLALLPIVRRARGAALLGLVVAGQLVLAAPFDAGAVAAGGGARLLVAVIPAEHALMALALARLADRQLARAAMTIFAVALAGFAVHASFDHEALAASDLGRPHYEPDALRESVGPGTKFTGLLFFDDDQGFELAYDPEALARHEMMAVRLRGDDHDRLLYDSLGHPPVNDRSSSRRYTATGASASANVWTPPGSGDAWRFEAESDWPPAAVWGGRPEVLATPGTCASEGKVMLLSPTGTDASVTLSLPVPRGPTPPERKTWAVTPRVMQRGGKGSATLLLVATPDGPPLAQWTWEDDAKTPTCIELPPQPVELGGDRTRAWLVLKAHGGDVALDKTTLRAK
ncbi:MAG: hypothetical protein ABSE49_08905 [Polyangiaceae bacterium]|jgi:hypothetical protein